MHYTHFMRLFTTLLASLIASPAFAAEHSPKNIPQDNIFNADISHPDLATAVRAFEQVCMPFVLHKSATELRIDKAHFKSQLAEQGFDFQSSERLIKRYKIEARRDEWKPPVIAINSGAINGGRVNTRTRGQFTVFSGISNQIVEATESRVSQAGEVFGIFLPARYKDKISNTDTYRHQSNNNLTASLDWKERPEYHPGKFCEIQLNNPEIDLAEFTEHFIKKDSDWKRDWTQREPMNTGWAQCVKEREDNGGTAEFLFAATHGSEGLKISLQRDDIYRYALCGS